MVIIVRQPTCARCAVRRNPLSNSRTDICFLVIRRGCVVFIVRTRRSNHNDNANDNNSFKKQRLCLTRRRIKRRGKQFHRPRPLRCSHILKATTYLEDLSCFCSKARRLDRNYNSDDNGRQEGLGEKRALDNC